MALLLSRALQRSLMALSYSRKISQGRERRGEGEGKGKGVAFFSGGAWLIFLEEDRAIRDLCRALGWP